MYNNNSRSSSGNKPSIDDMFMNYSPLSNNIKLVCNDGYDPLSTGKFDETTISFTDFISNVEQPFHCDMCKTFQLDLKLVIVKKEDVDVEFMYVCENCESYVDETTVTHD